MPRNCGGAVRSAEQTARDRRDRIGVVSSPYRGVQRQAEVVGAENSSVGIVDGNGCRSDR